jgi:hypothetical protein
VATDFAGWPYFSTVDEAILSARSIAARADDGRALVVLKVVRQVRVNKKKEWFEVGGKK